MIKTLFIILIVVAFVIITFLLWWKFYFLRNPPRTIPDVPDAILSPADGKVIEILHYDISKDNIIEDITIHKRYIGKIRTTVEDISDKGYIVSIFMSPMDVHYNRAPIGGRVTFQYHKNGSFKPAYDFYKTLENEKNEIIIDDKGFRIKVIQIAGSIARRIESFVEVGNILKKGQIFGRINLGSQATLILPENIDIRVKKGERVTGGETIIALRKR